MNRKLTSLVLVALLGLGAGPEAKTEVQKLSLFIGEWTIHATWAGGGELVAHNVNQWALNGAHLQNQTFVGEGAQQYQRYLTLMSYDAKQGGLVSTSYAADGTVSSVRIETEDGKTFKFGYTPIGGEESKVRQTITFNNADEYRWVVEINQNGEWKQIMDGTWKRDQPKGTK